MLFFLSLQGVKPNVTYFSSAEYQFLSLKRTVVLKARSLRLKSLS
jgi:hypothetical protein